jgi:hypothetical protein
VIRNRKVLCAVVHNRGADLPRGKTSSHAAPLVLNLQFRRMACKAFAASSPPMPTLWASSCSPVFIL